MADKEQIEKLKRVILDDAGRKRDDAGHGGRMDDGGASRLEDQVRFFTLGQQGDIPVEWREYEKYLDPEWAEYERLKKKFRS